MTGGILSVLLLLGGGVLGGLLLACFVRGARALVAWMLWLAVPFVILGMVLVSEIDPSLSPQRAQYNLSFGFVLFSLLIAVPWLAANLVGWLIGRAIRGRRPAGAPLAFAARGSSRDDGFPAWSRSDGALDMADISERMYAIADRAGVARGDLPAVGSLDEGVRECLQRDKFDFIYAGTDGAGAAFDLRTVIADQLMYWVFRERAAAMASDRAGQQAILAGIDPRWGRQFAYERKGKAGG